MVAGLGEGHPILPEIVGHRKLAAEGVSARMHIHLVQFIIGGLKQDRHIQFGAIDQFGDGDLVTKVRQADDKSINVITVRLEMFRIELCIRDGLNSAVVRGFDRQDNGIDSQLVQLRQDLVACINAGRRAKQGATADDNA